MATVIHKRITLRYLCWHMLCGCSHPRLHPLFIGVPFTHSPCQRCLSSAVPSSLGDFGVSIPVCYLSAGGPSSLALQGALQAVLEMTTVSWGFP